ncbi:MAG: carbohydrate binding family 9 domain-containing protein [Vicinamibacterales bacterium]
MAADRLQALALVTLLVTAPASSAAAQEAPLELTRLSGPIVLDGKLDEPAWEQVPSLPLTMYTPVFRGQPTQRTEIRVAYDSDNLYVGGRFYDTDPSGIRVNSLYRDRWNGDDALAIYVDAFNDNQNAKWFGTTPAGMRFDLLVSDDGATLNDNWDTFWASATSVTSEGWFAEVRIPFSSLGFEAGSDGRAVMGLTVTRLVSRLDERVTFPEIDPKFPFRKPSVYVLGGGSRDYRAECSGALVRERDAARDIGVDVRYPLSAKLTLDLTANTDFAQVEADGQQIALDRFPLFFPERRRFFQEGSSIFDFVGSGGARLFHSRRIGLSDDGMPVTILGGARLVGKVSNWDIGALEMQTGEYGTTPGENFGVLRLRRPLLNAWSSGGVLVTSYYGGRRHNLALGADTSVRVRCDEYLGLKWSATIDSHDPDGLSLTERSLFDAKWERRTQRGLSYTGHVTRSGAHYLPELGFMPRTNVTTANVVGNWYFFTDRHKYFKRVYPGALAFDTFRNADRALESGQYAVWVQWDTKAGGGGWIEPKVFQENVLVPFRIGNTVTIPAGSYDFADLQVVNTMPSGKRLRTDIDLRAGTYFDGRRTQLVLAPTWNINRHFEVGGDYQLNLLRFSSRGQAENIHLLRLRLRTALDARASGNAFMQYNSTTDRVDFNVRLRYAVAEGTDLWIVYNEGLDTDRALGQQERLTPLSVSRALVVKYSHTLRF